MSSTHVLPGQGSAFDPDGLAAGLDAVPRGEPAVWVPEEGGAAPPRGSVRGAAWPAWLVVWLPVCAVMALVAAAYYPGVMRPDSVEQYRQALSGRYTDWHPPVMAWFWGLIDRGDGPRPMLLLHLLLAALGTGLIAGALWSGGRRVTAGLVLLAAAAPVPLGYLGVIMKDTTLAVSLLAATGIVAHFALRGRPVPLAAGACAALLLAFGMLLRFNAPFAAIPLVLCLLPGWWRARPLLRVAVGALTIGFVLVSLPAVTETAFRPERSDVRLSPIIYDLAGITHHSGRDQFPDLGTEGDLQASTAGCYTPVWWDTYSWGSCGFVFERMRALTQERRFNPYEAWLDAVLAEPVSYLRHRLSHANSNLRFLLPYGTSDVTFTETVANEFGFTFRPNILTAGIQAAGLLVASTPAGWPITWIALALGWLILAPALHHGPVRMLMVALALSALVYGASYLVFSVASDLRYHLWTMMAAALATAIGLGEVIRWGRPRTGRLALALAPVVLVAVLGMVWRLYDLPPI